MNIYLNILGCIAIAAFFIIAIFLLFIGIRASTIERKRDKLMSEIFDLIDRAEETEHLDRLKTILDKVSGKGSEL